MAGRSDVEVLSRSFRSRVLLLALLLLLGLAAALWTSMQETGLGAPEDRRRILIATAEPGIDYFAIFEKGGFLVEVDELEDWLSTARTAAPESKAEGLPLLLEHADREGIALVVFERPAGGDWFALDWGELELDPPLDSIERLSERDYVVVSVGDYAFPHRVSVDDPGADPLVRLPGFGALQAVYRQALISARGSPDRPTLAELRFEDATRLAREMAERPAGFATTIASAQASVERLLDEPWGSAPALVPPGQLATGTAITTPDGGILLFHYELVVYSNDARTLEFEPAPEMQLSWISPAAVTAGLASGEFERTPCTALAGGVLSMAEAPRIEAAVDGSAVAIGTGEGEATVWRKTEAPGCEWVAVAEIDRIEGVVLAPRSSATGSSRSVAARAEKVADRGRVLVWSVSEDEEELDLQLVLEQPGRRVGALAFLDDRYLALASLGLTEQGPDHRVDLLDRTRPEVVLSVPVESLVPGRQLRDLVVLAPAEEASGPELIAALQNPLGRFELARLRVGKEAWDAFADATEGASEFELTAEQLEVEIVSETDSLLGFDAKAGMLLFSSVEGENSAELFSLNLARETRRRLTNNWIRDYLPRLSADGSHAVFVSRIQVNFTSTPFSVPRVVAVPNTPK